MFERSLKNLSFDTILKSDPMYAEWTSDKVVDLFNDAARDGIWKAVGTGSPNLPSGFASTANVQIQNLDGMFTSVLFDESHLVLWNWLPRVPSINYKYEYTVRDRYGSPRAMAGFTEGGAPKGSTSGWTRKSAEIRWLGTRGGITHQGQVTSRLGGAQMDLEGEENRARTLELLNKLEVMALHGDSTILAEDGKTVNFDGILKQMNDGLPERVVDMGGQPLTPADLEDYALKLSQEGFLHGLGKVRMFTDGQVIADFSKLFAATQRVNMGGDRGAAYLPGATRSGGFVPGVPIDGYKTNFGFIPFEQSFFMDPVPGGRALLAARTPAEAADNNAVAAPTAPTMAAAQDTTNSHFTADDANTYYYVVGAVNDSGESLGTVSASGVAVVSGDKVTVTVTKITGATFYRIYRGLKSDGTDAQYIGMVVQPSGSTTTLVDYNGTRPGTKTAVILNQSPEDICIPMMSPLMKYPLAVVNTTIEFLYMIYCTLVVKAPKRAVVFKNIGALPS